VSAGGGVVAKNRMKILIFANGKPKDGTMVRRAIADSQAALIIAADGGTNIAWHYQQTPNIVIGDMDSLSEQELARVKVQGAEIRPFSTEKNETDLELALLCASELGATWIRIIGGIGGRFDQMLANVYLLALPELIDVDIALVAAKQEIRLLQQGIHKLSGEIGDTISLIPVSGDVSGVSTHNLKYPLENETLRFGPARGISNVMQAAQVQITIDSGVLLCIHTEGRA
jgi:thiamine pyrophosphokinase